MGVHRKAFAQEHQSRKGAVRTHRVRLSNWEAVEFQLQAEKVEFKLQNAHRPKDKELFLGVVCSLSANKFHELLQRAGVV